MTFEIIWDTDARKFLKKLTKKIASRIVRKVDFSQHLFKLFYKILKSIKNSGENNQKIPTLLCIPWFQAVTRNLF